jgi:polyisoprenoid-binding protein YceI
MTTTTASPLTQTDASTWLIDAAHTTVEFQVKHMMFSTVKGRFSGVRGSIVDVAGDPTLSSVDVEIDALSLSTGDPQRDGHLKSADFLDVEKYPTLTFKSSGITGTREAFKMTGYLTLHGVSHQVTFDVTYNGQGTSPYGKTVAGFSAETKFNRKDWGLNWNVALEAGGVLVSDQVKVLIELEAVKQD